MWLLITLLWVSVGLLSWGIIYFNINKKYPEHPPTVGQRLQLLGGSAFLGPFFWAVAKFAARQSKLNLEPMLFGFKFW